MNKKTRIKIIKEIIEEKKTQVIRYDDPHWDYETGYQKGFITALELLLEENIL